MSTPETVNPGIIAITGLKHSGKSSVTPGIARALGLPALDLDDETLTLMRRGLEKPETGNTLRDYYRAYGGDTFRRYEADALEALTEERYRGLLACGGGLVDNARGRTLLTKVAFIVYLTVDFDTLYERVARGGIPPFLDADDPKGSFLALAQRREAAYRELAHLVVPLGDRSVGEAVALLTNKIKENHYAR